MNNSIQTSLCNFIKEVYNVDVAYSQIDSYEKLHTFMRDSSMSMRMINTEFATNMNFVLANAGLQLMPARSVDISRAQLTEIFCRRLYEAESLEKDPVFESTMTVLAGYAELADPKFKEKFLLDSSRANVEATLISAANCARAAYCYDIQQFIEGRYKRECRMSFNNGPAAISEILDIVYGKEEQKESVRLEEKQRVHPYVILTTIGLIALVTTFIYLRSKGLL